MWNFADIFFYLQNSNTVPLWTSSNCVLRNLTLRNWFPPYFWLQNNKSKYEISINTFIDEDHLYAGVEGQLVVLQGVSTLTVRPTVVVLAVVEAGARRDSIGNLWVEVLKKSQKLQNETFF